MYPDQALLDSVRDAVNRGEGLNAEKDVELALLTLVSSVSFRNIFWRRWAPHSAMLLIRTPGGSQVLGDNANQGRRKEEGLLLCGVGGARGDAGGPARHRGAQQIRRHAGRDRRALY
jgi:hypothetical protein